MGEYYGLTRRQVLEYVKRGLEASVVGTLAALVMSTQDEHIFRSRLQPLIEERQRQLNSIAAKLGLCNVRRVYYDHFGDLVDRVYNSHGDRMREDPKYPELLAALRSHPHFRNYTILEIFRELTAEHESTKSKSGATTEQYPFDFGKGIDSDVYVSPYAWEEGILPSRKGLVKIPTEEKIKFVLRHEEVHATQNRGGIKLAEGLIIDSSNYHKFIPAAIQFIGETEAYIKIFEESKQLGEDDPQFILASNYLMNYFFSEASEIVRVKEFTAHENLFIDFQKKKLEAIVPKILKYFEGVEMPIK